MDPYLTNANWFAGASDLARAIANIPLANRQLGLEEKQMALREAEAARAADRDQVLNEQAKVQMAQMGYATDPRFGGIADEYTQLRRTDRDLAAGRLAEQGARTKLAEFEAKAGRGRAVTEGYLPAETPEEEALRARRVEVENLDRDTKRAYAKIAAQQAATAEEEARLKGLTFKPAFVITQMLKSPPLKFKRPVNANDPLSGDQDVVETPEERMMRIRTTATMLGLSAADLQEVGLPPTILDPPARGGPPPVGAAPRQTPIPPGGEDDAALIRAMRALGTGPSKR